jgi:tRNA-dihydrouridine synthase C
MLPLLSVFWQLVSVRVIPKYRAGRVKQWLHLMARTYPQADAAFRQIRTVNDSRQVEGILTDWITQAGHLAPTQPAGRSWDNGDLDAHALQKEMF